MTTTRVPLLLLVAASALLLAGCTPPAPVDSAAPTPTPSATPTPAPTEAPPTATPTAGDCPATAGSGPVIYTVFTGDSTTPVTMTYQAFNADGSIPVITETVTGPVVTRIGYDCTSGAWSAPWTFTATSSSPDSIGCVQAFGGKLVKTDSQYNEGATTPMTADCTGHPGM